MCESWTHRIGVWTRLHCACVRGAGVRCYVARQLPGEHNNGRDDNRAVVGANAMEDKSIMALEKLGESQKNFCCGLKRVGGGTARDSNTVKVEIRNKKI